MRRDCSWDGRIVAVGIRSCPDQKECLESGTATATPSMVQRDPSLLRQVVVVQTCCQVLVAVGTGQEFVDLMNVVVE